MLCDLQSVAVALPEVHWHLPFMSEVSFSHSVIPFEKVKHTAQTGAR